MSINLYCDSCKHEYVLESVENSLVTLNGKEYEVLWFACPKCHKVHVVGIRDMKYHRINSALEIKREVLRRVASSKHYSRADYEKALNEADREARRLKKYSDRLFGKFTGTFTIATSENNRMELVYLP